GRAAPRRRSRGSPGPPPPRPGSAPGCRDAPSRTTKPAARTLAPPLPSAMTRSSALPAAGSPPLRASWRRPARSRRVAGATAREEVRTGRREGREDREEERSSGSSPSRSSLLRVFAFSIRSLSPLPRVLVASLRSSLQIVPLDQDAMIASHPVGEEEKGAVELAAAVAAAVRAVRVAVPVFDSTLAGRQNAGGAAAAVEPDVGAVAVGHRPLAQVPRRIAQPFGGHLRVARPAGEGPVENIV